jgi:hypothetical protein
VEDHESDDQADDRICAGQAEPDKDRAGEDAEADESVDTGVFAVCDECRALQAVPGAEADLGGDLVADEANHPSQSQQPELGPDDVWTQIDSRLARAKLLALQGNHMEAKALATEAISIADTTQAPVMQADA